MITSFKIFENKNEPQVGDYVKFEENLIDFFEEEIIYFLKNNIGQIIKIDPDGEFNYLIRFNKNIPIKKKREMRFSRDEIYDWSSDKEILKIKNELNKYNL